MLVRIINKILRRSIPFAVIRQVDDRSQKEVICSLQARGFWENEEVREIVKSMGAEELGSFVDYQKLHKKIKGFKNTIIFSLVTKEYIVVGENWVRYISSLGLRNYVLFCGDKESYEHFQNRGVLSLEVKLPYLSGNVRNQSGFLPKGLLMASLKFPICTILLKEGYNVVFSDIDAFWIKNPMMLLENGDHDIAFQNVYQFPQEVVRLWGFAACSGFFFVRNSKASLELIKSAHQFVINNCDDQLALNLALIKEEMRWEYPDIEIVKLKIGKPLQNFLAEPRSGYGIYNPVRGRSANGVLTGLSLPQELFRRHMFLDLSLDTVYVFHPNSPKSENSKLDVFEKFGLPIDRSLSFD